MNRKDCLEGITPIIPDRKQIQKEQDKISSNPYHKDHFQYNYKEDTYTCPEKQTLHFKYQYE